MRDIELQSNVMIGSGNLYEIIEIPTIRVFTLDTCYAHAVLDRVFVWYWLINDIKNKYPEFTHFNLLVGKDMIEQYPDNLKNIDEKAESYKGVYKTISELIPNTSILFEHIIGPTQFKYLFVPPYHDKWQRTPWNCEFYYPGRNVPMNEVVFSDEEIYSKLQSFRNLVLEKYETNPTNNLIIIDRRKEERKFDKNTLNKLIERASKNTSWNFDGVKYLEDMTFEEQVKLFASSKIIISMHGAALINLLWSQMNSIIYEIDVQTNRSRMYKRISKLTNSEHYYSNNIDNVLIE
jgi:hypothetical protein